MEVTGLIESAHKQLLVREILSFRFAVTDLSRGVPIHTNERDHGHYIFGMLQQVTGPVQMDYLSREIKGYPRMNLFTGKQLHGPRGHQTSDRTSCPYGTRLCKVHQSFFRRSGLLF